MYRITFLHLHDGEMTQDIRQFDSLEQAMEWVKCLARVYEVDHFDNTGEKWSITGDYNYYTFLTLNDDMY